MESISISEIKSEEFNKFFIYLDTHLAENGKADLLFIPLTNKQIKVDSEFREKFTNGFNIEFGRLGWRKLWIAKDQKGLIIGHIDIRSTNELNTGHRVLLGMGVDVNFRKQKIGQQSLHHVVHYCKNNKDIHWLDLEVMSSNTPAIQLYKTNYFIHLSDCKDMFRINGKSYDYTSMTLDVS